MEQELAIRQARLEADWKTFQQKTRTLPPETPPFVIVMILLVMALIVVVIVIIAMSRQSCQKGEHTTNLEPNRSRVSDTDQPKLLTDTAAGIKTSSSLSLPSNGIHSVRFNLEKRTMTILGRDLSRSNQILYLEYFSPDPSAVCERKPEVLSCAWITPTTILVTDPEMVIRCMGVLDNSSSDRTIGVWGLRIRRSTDDDILFLANDATLANAVDTYLTSWIILQSHSNPGTADRILSSVPGSSAIPAHLRFVTANKKLYKPQPPEHQHEIISDDAGFMIVPFLSSGWHCWVTTTKTHVCGLWTL